MTKLIKTKEVEMELDDFDKIEYTTSKEDYDNLHENEEPLITRGLYLPEIGDCNIVVNAHGGNIPHFEIHALDNDFKTCLMLFEPRYYFLNCFGFQKLTNSQIDELIKFLQKVQFKVNNYSWLCYHWDNLNSMKKYQHYDNWQIADYNLLKE